MGGDRAWSAWSGGPGGSFPGTPELERRARLLARRYLEGMVEPRSVRWVGNMRARLRLLHPRRRHHPALGPPRPLAALGA